MTPNCVAGRWKSGNTKEMPEAHDVCRGKPANIFTIFTLIDLLPCLRSHQKHPKSSAIDFAYRQLSDTSMTQRSPKASPAPALESALSLSMERRKFLARTLETNLPQQSHLENNPSRSPQVSVKALSPTPSSEEDLPLNGPETRLERARALGFQNGFMITHEQ